MSDGKLGARLGLGALALLFAGAMAYGFWSLGYVKLPALPVMPAKAGPARPTAPAVSAPGSGPSAPADVDVDADDDAPPSDAAPGDFAFEPPGKLTGTLQGVADPAVYVPGMRFPLKAPRAYAKPVSSGPGADACDTAAFAYPWSDSFCEAGASAAPLCPAGTGRLGQDLRPGACKAGKSLAAAAEDGTITQVGDYSVYLGADSGRTYVYLHLQMDRLRVKAGQRVVRGQPLGAVSDRFGDKTVPLHLHFEIKEAVTYDGTTLTTRVPPYTSLVDAYQRLLKGAP